MVRDARRRERLKRALQCGIALGDGGYLVEHERHGYVDSGPGREKVGTGRGSGQFTPEVGIERPEALRDLHREFLRFANPALRNVKGLPLLPTHATSSPSRLASWKTQAWTS